MLKFLGNAIRQEKEIKKYIYYKERNKTIFVCRWYGYLYRKKIIEWKKIKQTKKTPEQISDLAKFWDKMLIYKSQLFTIYKQ